MKNRQVARVTILIILSLLLVSCSSDASNQTPALPTDIEEDDTVISNEPRVFFTNIEDSDVVKSPVALAWSSENFIIEPWGDVSTGAVVREGAGHLHIIIDSPCIVAGETIPKPDDGSIHHYLLGGTDTQLTLSPGEHNLCLQAGNGAHTALPGDGMMVEITIFVEE
jgi:hypothetical protein